MRSILLLLSLSATSSLAPPPGALFNLSSFLLQLPTSTHGGVTEVKQPALDSYSSEYFYTDPADKGMTFWCPQNGATTSGSSFPRSELRETLDFDLSPGLHTLNATVTVLQTTSTQSITIGQAHVDGLSGHCSIFVELEWTRGAVVAHLRDKACRGVDMALGSYALGEPVSYSITLSGDTARITTDKVAGKPYSYTWLPASTRVYFKAGDYLQVKRGGGGGAAAAAPAGAPPPPLLLPRPRAARLRNPAHNPALSPSARRTAATAPRWAAR